MKQTLREGREGGRQRGLPWVILSCDILQGATPTPFSKPPPRHHPPIHLSHLFRDTFLSELWHSSTQFSTLHVIRLSIQITIPHCHLYPSLLPYSPYFLTSCEKASANTVRSVRGKIEAKVHPSYPPVICLSLIPVRKQRSLFMCWVKDHTYMFFYLCLCVRTVRFETESTMEDGNEVSARRLKHGGM